MKKEIKFSLVFRDMWQSAGKYVPRVDGSVVILGGLTFVNFPLCIHLC